MLQNRVLKKIFDKGTTCLGAAQVIIPKQEAKDLWANYHDRMGHLSAERVLAALRQRCYWPRIVQDVKEWTQGCIPMCLCQTRIAGEGPFVTSYPFEVVGIDYLSLGRPEDCYSYILVMTDLFSNYPLAVPTKVSCHYSSASV